MIKVAIVEDDERDVAILRGFLERYCEEQQESVDIRHFGDAFDFVSDYTPFGSMATAPAIKLSTRTMLTTKSSTPSTTTAPQNTTLRRAR